MQAGAQKIGQQQLVIFEVSSERDLETAFATFVQRGAGALLVGTGGFLNSKRDQIVALANRYALPASYSQREGVVAGGLISYGTSITECLPSSWHLQWKDSQGREAGRSARHAVHQIRSRN